MPKAQWDITSQATFEPVRPYQFIGLFFPPMSIANELLPTSIGQTGEAGQTPSTPPVLNPGWSLFSTLREAKIPTLDIEKAHDNVMGSPIYYANKMTDLPTFSTTHREFQGWFAYRAFYAWARKAYNLQTMTIGYQYDYKGTVIILNSPTFQSAKENNKLLQTNQDMLTLLKNMVLDEFWIFGNAWPSSVPGPSFTYAGTDLINYDVTWTMDRMLSSTDILELSKQGQDFTKELPGFAPYVTSVVSLLTSLLK